MPSASGEAETLGRDGLKQTFEQAPSVGVAVRLLQRALRMRHHPEDITCVVEDAGDAPGGTIDLFAIAEGHSALAFKPVQRRRVGLEVSVMVGDRNDDVLAGIILRREEALAVVSTFSPTGLQTKLRPALRIRAPGRSPVSVSTWKPLQMPSTGTPRPAASATARMIGERAAMAPERR